MTIKELEQALDMSRANIRYYEKEGLIAPVRAQNGYRNYSEADLTALRRIQLLRQLGVSVEEIHGLQRGEVLLEEALSKRISTLETERLETEQAKCVCERLRREGACYDSLEAEPYLHQLKEGGAWRDAKAHDRLPGANHPWLRLSARMLDLSLYWLSWMTVRMLVLRIGPGGAGLLDMIVPYVAMLLVEPFLLSTWGYTPGKWLFGLCIRDEEGDKLSVQAAAGRTWTVFVWGLGLGIPFYNLYSLYRRYSACAAGETMRWDEGLSYTIRDLKSWRCILFAVIQGGVIGLCIMVALQAQMPKHRGDLNGTQLMENIRDICHYQGISTGLVDPETTCVEVGENTIVLEQWGPVSMRFVNELDGTLTQVELYQAISDNPDFFLQESTELRTVAFSLVGASREYTLFTLPRAEWLDWVTGLSSRDAAMEAGGWRMEYRVESEGMTVHDYFLLRDVGAADAWVRWSFTITKLEG